MLSAGAEQSENKHGKKFYNASTLWLHWLQALLFSTSLQLISIIVR